MDNKLIKRAVWIIAILGIFLAFELVGDKFKVGGTESSYKSQVSTFSAEGSEQNPSTANKVEMLNSINARIEGETAKELKQNPNQTKSEASATAAIRAGGEDLQSGNGVRTRIEKASDQFLGFYSMNAIFRARYCEKLGVPIPAFVMAFKKVNDDEYQIASAQWIKDTPRLGTAEERIKFGSPILMPALEQDMLDVTRMMKLSSPKQACVEMQRQGDLYGDDMALQKVNPVLYAALHGR
ncbi:hypothetical protein ICN49_02385 [Polynucleobacter sp. MWH-Mekk-B1]|uniref:hypothetical protein n=1 Tax=Polynucleobacter finlandensis TaxID=1855894 RepID=UPI001C0ACD3E|nr:hypothetical protein [Polynucleobacter finlandensis]MBU3543760.1 hypothetical protein [Polynucleobacter finlandensis]